MCVCCVSSVKTPCPDYQRTLLLITTGDVSDLVSHCLLKRLLPMDMVLFYTTVLFKRCLFYDWNRIPNSDGLEVWRVEICVGEVQCVILRLSWLMNANESNTYLVIFLWNKVKNKPISFCRLQSIDRGQYVSSLSNLTAAVTIGTFHLYTMLLLLLNNQPSSCRKAV
jgi:hypothetical protein